MDLPPQIVIEINGLPRMSNGGHGHWRTDHYAKKKWKEDVCRSLFGKVPKVPYKKIRARFIRYSSVSPDYDGLVHGFKATQDGLVLSGLVSNDRMSNIEATYKWEKAKRGKGKIRIEIWPMA